ncbi:MAG: helix-turn-helix domain-containing protein [Clostridiales bacterium]|nr:helix-turn-helix domain-containing protein [Clostridiales bacterium]
MKNNFPANIKSFRKERGLTQEQLAEVFGVTVGAVHKWEAALSTPDISLLMEMADFFDISLDVLVGFDIRDNRVSILARKLRKLTDSMDPSGPEEAEKALKKYPNSFNIVYESAYLYRAFAALFEIDKKYCVRAKELYEQAIRLISQNTDPNIDETHLYGQLAQVYLMMGDTDTSLKIFQDHNAGYIYNSYIGSLLVEKGQYAEAETYLSYALVNQISARVNLISNKARCYLETKNYKEAEAILEMGIKENEFFRRNEEPFYLDRIDSLFLTALAYVELKIKNQKKAKDLLQKAKKKAELFDAAPNYDARRERFVDIQEPCMAFDTTGKTSIEGIENTIKYLKSQELAELWKSINK